METIQLRDQQHTQMAELILQMTTARQIAEAFVEYFAKELGVNLQLYRFNADVLAFEPVQGYAPPTGQAMPQNFSEQVQEPVYSENGRIEAI
jgi:hypothetical protein